MYNVDAYQRQAAAALYDRSCAIVMISSEPEDEEDALGVHFVSSHKFSEIDSSFARFENESSDCDESEFDQVEATTEKVRCVAFQFTYVYHCSVVLGGRAAGPTLSLQVRSLVGEVNVDDNLPEANR